MRLEQAVFNRLSTYASLMALVSTRIYPLALPQNGTYPAVTYFRVSSPRIRTFGTNLGASTRLQVSCWARSYLAAKGVADQVIAALDGFSGTLGGVGGVPVLALDLDNETDIYEPETGLYHVPLDFTIWHTGN